MDIKEYTIREGGSWIPWSLSWINISRPYLDAMREMLNGCEDD